MRYPIIVGAGVCKYAQNLPSYLRDDVSIGAITLGSLTPNENAGNTGKLFYPDDYDEFTRCGFGSNSFGMPSAGYEKSHADLPNESVIPIILSLGAFSIEDFLFGIQRFDVHPAISAIKLNISCPNKGLTPIGLDLNALHKLITEISRLAPRYPIWIKTPRYVTREKLDQFADKYPQLDFSGTPTIDESFLREFALLLKGKEDIIRALVVANTLGNIVYRHPNGTTVTTPNDGRAGLSGPIVKELSIDLLRELGELLPDTIDLIASGGVVNGDDGVDYLEQTKAKAFCCTSGPFWYGDGPRFFTDLLVGSERLQNYLMQ